MVFSLGVLIIILLGLRARVSGEYKASSYTSSSFISTASPSGRRVRYSDRKPKQTLNDFPGDIWLATDRVITRMWVPWHGGQGWCHRTGAFQRMVCESSRLIQGLGALQLRSAALPRGFRALTVWELTRTVALLVWGLCSKIRVKPDLRLNSLSGLYFTSFFLLPTGLRPAGLNAGFSSN